MLDFLQQQENIWEPPGLDDEDMLYMLADSLPGNLGPEGDFLLITQVEPYIDSIYVHFTSEDSLEAMYKKRFVFCDGYRWDYESERFFTENIVNNQGIRFSYAIENIFKYYSNKYPDWKLKRYYTTPMRMLEHIYHCMRRNSAKEMLYKAGLDELAAHIEDDLEELNLLASKPSDLYGGLSIKVLRAMNCRDGSVLLGTERMRSYLKRIQKEFPDSFKDKLNDAQCRYLKYLIDGNLTVNEIGRLFNARKEQLQAIWAPSQYELFIQKEKANLQAIDDSKEIIKIDPIYKDYIKRLNFNEIHQGFDQIHSLRYYLLVRREEYDKEFRRSNRKRNSDWQERGRGYVVRYPQTINDFCRESIYMSNCLLTYLDAYINNNTTLLFIRKEDDFNTPFITMEIFDGELQQAYKRFNEECTPDEIKWILKYCDRHLIDSGGYGIDENL